MLCHAEKTAPGTVAVGIAAKWAFARPTARPEFCMPTSMERATAFSREGLRNEQRQTPGHIRDSYAG